MIQFTTSQFVEEYDPTIEDYYRKQVNVDDQPCILEIIDTAGKEEYTSLNDQYIRDGQAFVLLYSITDRSSFEHIQNFYQLVLKVKDVERFHQIVVAANKVDLESEREVTREEGEQFAKKHGVSFLFFIFYFFIFFIIIDFLFFLFFNSHYF